MIITAGAKNLLVAITHGLPTLLLRFGDFDNNYSGFTAIPYLILHNIYLYENGWQISGGFMPRRGRVQLP